MMSVQAMPWILGIHAISTIMMGGLIWFVQIVHYPLMSRVGDIGFAQYEQSHTKRTGWVVAPLMLTELTTALLIFTQADNLGFTLPFAGLVCLGLIWASTALLQVPAHRTLEQGFDDRVHTRLVRTNWIRTVLWTARSVISIMLLVKL